MARCKPEISRRIRSFVQNPVTNLVKGVALLLIGLTDASQTIRGDMSHGGLRLGHGMIILGLFSILGSLPHFIDALDASARYLDRHGQERLADEGANQP